MTINWKLRFKNKATWLYMVSLLILLSQQLGLTLPGNVSEVANTILTLLVVMGIIHDPTTKGFSDSERALGYDSLGGQDGR